MDRHRFDAESDPYQTFHFVAEQDSVSDITPGQVLHVLENLENYSEECQFTLFYLSVSVIGVTLFNVCL